MYSFINSHNSHVRLHAYIYTFENPFWKNVVTAYSEWFGKFKTICQVNAEKECLRGNPRINIPFCNQLYKNGIIYLRDLFTQEGRQLTKNELDTHCNTNIMFTTYFAIWKALHNYWKNEIENSEKDYNMEFPTNIALITKDKKGTSSIRNVWTNVANTVIPIG